MDIHKLTGPIGAEILGVDLSKNLSSEVVRSIRQALLDHLVIFLGIKNYLLNSRLRSPNCLVQSVDLPYIKR